MPTDAERDAAEIERQIKAIHESRADVLDLPVTPFGRNAELAARERKVQELVEALGRYAEHKAGCKENSSYEPRTCGLDDTRSALAAARGKK